MNAYDSLRHLTERTEPLVVHEVTVLANAGVLRPGEFEITVRDVPRWLHNRQEGGFAESFVTWEEIREQNWQN